MLRGLLLLLAACILSAAHPSGNNASNQPSANQATPERTESPKVVPPTDRKLNEPEVAQPKQTDPYAKERNEREKRDILAQERAAKWAKAPFWAVVAQTVLALGALIALVLDLTQNRKSTEAQLRAYVLLETAEILLCSKLGDRMQGGDEHPQQRYVELTVKNYGSTPAHDVAVKFGVSVFPYPLDREFPEWPDSEPFAEFDFAPTATRMTRLLVRKSGISHDLINFGSRAIYVWGTITYKDVFGVGHTTRIELQSCGESYRNGRMQGTEKGNWSD